MNNAKKQKNNRKGKTRDLFKKTGNIKGTFHPKMSTVKARNCKDLIEAEEIKKRWKEYTKQLYKKVLNDLDNHDSAVSSLRVRHTACEVKWALGRHCCQ